MNVRTKLLQLHRWTGLTVGLVILMLAITGAINSFRPAVEPVVARELLTVPTCSDRVSLDELAGRARAAHRSGQLDYIRVTVGEPGALRMPAARVRFADPQDDVYLDPCTARVLGERPRYGGFFARVEQLHILRYAENGVVRSITGVCAIAFAIVLVAGGIALWWPRRGGRVRSLRTRPGLTGHARLLDVHKTAGLYASAVLLMLVVTGLPLTFDWYRDGVYKIAGSPLPDKAPLSEAQAGMPRLSMQAFWDRVQALEPDVADALLKFPKGKSAPLEGFLLTRDAPHPNARTLFALDAYTGQVLSHKPYAESSAGHKLYFWMLSFHTGQVGGAAGQTLLLAGVLVVPLLAYTGMAGFLRRRRIVPVRPIHVRVNRIVMEAQDVKSFELVSATGDPLPPFAPGAHIDLTIEPGLTRPYSLCGDPRDRSRYLIAVKRVADSRGGSQALHERIAEGDVLTIGQPRQHFRLRPTARHHVLIAGGIGITPLLAMARQLASEAASFELHVFVRTPEQAAFRDVLSSAPLRDNVRFHHGVDRECLPDRLREILLPRPSGATLYLCGPRPFMDLAIDVAAPHWLPHAIRREHFRADPAAAAGEPRAFEIELARSGAVFQVPACKSALQVLDEHGVSAVRSCEQGVCGSCMTRVLGGIPDHRDAFLTADERCRGRTMLLCVSRAATDRLVLDL
jgi:ferredoxin-NADP reductase